MSSSTGVHYIFVQVSYPEFATFKFVRDDANSNPLYILLAHQASLHKQTSALLSLFGNEFLNLSISGLLNLGFQIIQEDDIAWGLLRQP